MRIPGSKYVANRVLLLSALARGRSRVSNVPQNSDMELLLRMLQGAGVSLTTAGNTVEIEGTCGALSLAKDTVIDAGESGTLLRFAAGLASLLPGKTLIDAGPRNRQRPIEPLLQSLGDLGVPVLRGDGSGGFPITVFRGLCGGSTVIAGEYSSQFISSLLIVAPYAGHDVEIRVRKPVVSSHYIDLTISEMRRYGVKAERITGPESDLFLVKAGQEYISHDRAIPGDWSSVNYLLAASLILGREMLLRGMDVKSNPAESEFISILRKMGCSVVVQPRGVKINRTGEISGIEVDMKDSPDSVLTVIPIALAATGRTVIRNISHLIYKESNRIRHTARELGKLGADVTATGDSITITGGKKLVPAVVNTYNDHRLAMCLGLVQLTNPGMEILGRECVNKSFPEFWDYIAAIREEGEKCLEIQ